MPGRRRAQRVPCVTRSPFARAARSSGARFGMEAERVLVPPLGSLECGNPCIRMTDVRRFDALDATATSGNSVPLPQRGLSGLRRGMKYSAESRAGIWFAPVISLMLFGASASWAQQRQSVKFEAPAANTKYTEQHSIAVGDVAGHDIRIFENLRTFPKDPLPTTQF